MSDSPTIPPTDVDVDVLAEMLIADRKESGDALEHLALKLSFMLPSETAIERKGGFFSKSHVEKIQVSFSDAHYFLTREKNGPLARKSHVVRGVHLSTKELPIDAWIKEVAAAIQRLSHESASAKDALEKFIFGGM